MMTLDISNLTLCLTHRCNMQCQHCMRGDAENKDLPQEILDALFCNSKFNLQVGELTLTGGEVSLCVDKMQKVCDAIENGNAYVHNGYLVTNGKLVTDDFLLTCIRFFALMDDEDGDLNGLSLSTDIFHEEPSRENLRRLRQLRWFREDDKKLDPLKPHSLLNLGRAKQFSQVYTLRDPLRYDLSVEDWGSDYCHIDELCIELDGSILPVCDYAYDEIS